MRHLLFIFSEKPGLFEMMGFAILLLSTILQITAFITGPISVAGIFHIFDMHTQALLLLSGIFGGQFYLFGCMLYLQSKDQPMKLTRKLIFLDEGVLFFTLLATVCGCLGLTCYIGAQWSISGFSNLNLAHNLLLGCHILALFITFSVGLLGLHVLKKAHN